MDQPAAVDVVSSNHRVLDVRLDSVVLAQHGADATLGVLSATLAGLSLGDDGNAAVLCHLERIAKAGNPTANDQEVEIAHAELGRGCLNAVEIAQTSAARA